MPRPHKAVEKLYDADNGGAMYFATLAGVFDGVVLVALSKNLEELADLLALAVLDFQFSETLPH